MYIKLEEKMELMKDLIAIVTKYITDYLEERVTRNIFSSTELLLGQFC